MVDEDYLVDKVNLEYQTYKWHMNGYANLNVKTPYLT